MAFPTSKTRRVRVGHGVAQTLTAQDAQQAVVEPCEEYIGRAVHPLSKKLEFDGDSLCVDNVNLRVRELTERECFRLMGVKDEDFDKIKVNQSKSSLYHLAGDSIVTNVLMALFNQML